MEKFLIACSMIGAFALIACADSQPTSVDSQPNSVTTNYAVDAWFSASADGATIHEVGGKFSTKSSSESTYVVKDGKIEFDSAIDDPVSFVLNNETAASTTDLFRVTFQLDPSVVPVSGLPAVSDLGGIKIAFALAGDDSSTNFYYMVASKDAWTKLNFATIPMEPFSLKMKFDDSDASAKKVQFVVSVNEGDEASEWITYSGLAQKPTIDFVGSGKVESFAADQLSVVSAEVVIEGGGSVTIDKKDADAMAKLVGDSETVEQAFSAMAHSKVPGIESSCGLSVAEAYAIGLIANEGGTMTAKDDGTFKVKADAQAKITNGIKVNFVNVLTPGDKTATITYSLEGSADGTTYTPIENTATHDPNEIVIPTDKVGTGDGKYRYFKVKTTVKLAGAND